jgi:tRNA G18 (ribose-2'-O)-methylase SpoU
MKQLSLEALERVSVEQYKLMEKIPLVVILDDVRSMNNVGSVFRTCDAFRTERLVLCGITPQPPHRDINKTALGATESVQWEYHQSIAVVLADYRAKGYKIYALEQTNQSIRLNKLNINFNEKALLILGNEVSGVSQEALDLSDVAIEIPQEGTKHSLNVSVAAGVALYWFFQNFL